MRLNDNIAATEMYAIVYLTWLMGYWNKHQSMLYTKKYFIHGIMHARRDTILVFIYNLRERKSNSWVRQYFYIGIYRPLLAFKVAAV